MTKIGNNYYDNMEEVDITLLEEFNKQLNWFKQDITATTRGTRHDAEAIDVKGHKTWMELKKRKETNDTLTKYGDVLIEPSKLAHMTNLMSTSNNKGSGHTKDEKRLYVNFTADGAIVFDLNKQHTMKYYPNHYHYDPGSKRYVNEDRFGIPTSEAMMIFKLKGGKYIAEKLS